MIFKVRRFDPGSGRSDFVHYEVRVQPGMTVLSALTYIRARLDDSLAFRSSCHQGACGSCAMLINGRPALACITGVSEVRPDRKAPDGPRSRSPSEVCLEPLPGFQVTRDLVVDLEGFFTNYRQIRAGVASNPPGPSLCPGLNQAQAEEIESYARCIQCACCNAACPVFVGNQRFLGPAALTLLYRLALDPRLARDRSQLAQADSEVGWWGCRSCSECARVCPKNISPQAAIDSARNMLRAAEEQRNVSGMLAQGEAEEVPVVEVAVRRAQPEACLPTAGSDSLLQESPWSGAFWLAGA
ncbi:MAG: succinate dehydrogenase/fumarate reductase iron-sulfur subunit [candidate division WOR-3 bacterium]